MLLGLVCAFSCFFFFLYLDCLCTYLLFKQSVLQSTYLSIYLLIYLSIYLGQLSYLSTYTNTEMAITNKYINIYKNKNTYNIHNTVLP